MTAMILALLFFSLGIGLEAQNPQAAEEAYRNDLLRMQELIDSYTRMGHAPPSFTQTGEVYLTSLERLPTRLSLERQFEQGAEAALSTGVKGKVKYILYDKKIGLLAQFVRRNDGEIPAYNLESRKIEELELAGFPPLRNMLARTSYGVMARVKSYLVNRIRWQPSGGLQVSYLVYDRDHGWLARVVYRKLQSYDLEGIALPDCMLYTARMINLKYIRFGSHDD